MSPISSAAQGIGVSGLAARIGVTPAAVHQWAAGHRPIPPDRCPAIERATDGKATVEQLRPDVRWVRVPDAAWPHPDGRPCIDVAAPVQQQEAQRAAA